MACLVMSSSPVPLKTRCVEQRCTLNLLSAETSSRWCVVQDLLGTINVEPSFLRLLAIPKNENAVDEQYRYELRQNMTAELNAISKETL
ncbi:hypothetical protein TNCV_3288431 [Trichonephila clavipes]|nr:hypothetical protein TNCV_3288431 [Trichonephila clavipes]